MSFHVVVTMETTLMLLLHILCLQKMANLSSTFFILSQFVQSSCAALHLGKSFLAFVSRDNKASCLLPLAEELRAAAAPTSAAAACARFL